MEFTCNLEQKEHIPIIDPPALQTMQHNTTLYAGAPRRRSRNALYRKEFSKYSFSFYIILCHLSFLTCLLWFGWPGINHYKLSGCVLEVSVFYKFEFLYFNLLLKNVLRCRKVGRFGLFAIRTVNCHLSLQGAQTTQQLLLHQWSIISYLVVLCFFQNIQSHPEGIYC